MEENESLITLNILKHKITVEDELIVHIYHKKKCPSPCPTNELIVKYLEDELFVADGFVVSDL